MDTRPQLINLQGKAHLEPELDARLDHLAKETGRTKSDYARQAIEEFLEDQEDYLLGIASLEQQQSRTTLATLRKELGLER
ncbi:MAG: ribbon-helix-helix protein, CopG family [Acidobacteriaceae bacterium]|nr:ribbon-helix-helix protein, CopG family [Acidobacteriaceae bacterium]MBV9034646.1 ribbon-helix-helix protein, CopG family [Acidobacteriaceae bacterium]MBV9226382.1 ribbon-helix-helix protein, CopG family [Acidobacteriaceae bacterium]MBV9678641.1 ribbon-helix-helix protein, CopG family [Acidobacteriaceae bacterium]MBV9937244.1 ribbon-helix-helix protein, CopG family [Acidobacteriaceae bacterium]